MTDRRLIARRWLRSAGPRGRSARWDRRYPTTTTAERLPRSRAPDRRVSGSAAGAPACSMIVPLNHPRRWRSLRRLQREWWSTCISGNGIQVSHFIPPSSYVSFLFFFSDIHDALNIMGVYARPQEAGNDAKKELTMILSRLERRGVVVGDLNARFTFGDVTRKSNPRGFWLTKMCVQQGLLLQAPVHPTFVRAETQSTPDVALVKNCDVYADISNQQWPGDHKPLRLLIRDAVRAMLPS